MYICHAQIINFRALQEISVPLMKFSVLIGENDVGKTSFLYALDAFFQNKKISDPDSFFRRETNKNILIELTFKDIPPDNPELNIIKRENDTIVINKEFSIDNLPIIKAVLDDGSKQDISARVLKKLFSINSFHFIPVRRDLSVQFSMNKTALLGKTLRMKMKNVIKDGDASESLGRLQQILKESL